MTRKFGQYIAWLNGTSVAREDTVELAREKAIAVFNLPSWQARVTTRGKQTVLRITKGARQTEILTEEVK